MTAAEVERDFFGEYNAEGSRLWVRPEENERFWDFGLVDSWRVVRVAHHAGGDGMDFWLAFRALGWHVDPAPQYSHLKKILTWVREEDALTLYEETGEALRIEALTEPAQHQAWERVQRQRRAAPEVWAEVDRTQVEYFRRMADKWQS
jgi:hypothetical protein